MASAKEDMLQGGGTSQPVSCVNLGVCVPPSDAAVYADSKVTWYEPLDVGRWTQERQSASHVPETGRG